MIRLLTVKDATRYSVVRSPGLDVVYKRMREDLKHVELYYRNRETYIKNTNVFVKLIKLLREDVTKDEMLYLDLISINAKYVAKSLKFTSPLSKGEVHHNLFGDNVILIDEAFVSPFDAGSDIAVDVCRILYSNHTSLWYMHPSQITTGTFSIQVDVIGIMMQYRRWALQRLANDEPITPNVFVYQVLYTNMIKQLEEIALLNRFFQHGIPQFDSNPHPFLVRDFEKDITKYFNKMRNNLTKNAYFYVQYLENIILPFSKNAYEFLFIGLIHINKQNMWAYFFSTLQYVLELFKNSDPKTHRRNRDVFTHLHIMLRAFRYDNIIETAPFGPLETEAMVLMNELRQFTKKG